MGVAVEAQGVVLAETGLHAARGVEDEDVKRTEGVHGCLGEGVDVVLHRATQPTGGV